MSGMLSMSRIEDKRRNGVVLARLRKGVHTNGAPVCDDGRPAPPRVIHVFDDHVDFATDYATSWCGELFDPGVLERVRWGAEGPHKSCLKQATISPALLEGVVILSEVMGPRYGDWVRVGDTRWTHTGSFNGIFERTCRPRGCDIGIEFLGMELVDTTRVEITACGVRNGCSRHLSRIETVDITDLAAFDRRLKSHEINATSIDLSALAWCLLAGNCALRPI